MQVPLSIYISMNFAIWSACGESPKPHHSMSLQGIATSKIKNFSHMSFSEGTSSPGIKNISFYPIPECIGHVLTTSFPSTISLISSMSRVSYFIRPSASFVTFSLFFISTFFVLLYDSCKIKKINTVLENKVVGHQNSYIMFKIIIKYFKTVT